MFVEKINEKIILVGTSHISEESVETVKKTISKEDPDCIAVELCGKRLNSLKNKKKWENMSISDVMRGGKTYLLLINIILSNYQKRLGAEFGVSPGSEMLKAIEMGEKLDKEIVLADRDIQTTFKRGWSYMSLVEKLKFIYYIFAGFFEDVDEEMVEALKDKDLLNKVLDEVAQEVPGIKKGIIDERNEYIALKILEKYRENKKIVAVIGAGHLKGVKEILEEALIKDIFIRGHSAELEKIPKKRSKAKIIAYAIPVLFIGMVIYGFYTRGMVFTVRMLLAWTCINGALSALGVICALGHPLSVLTALVAAPITSLNPALAAGWFAGATEAKMRTPMVKDFENLSRLERVRDYWKNNVTRILLVVTFANLGSTVGTFVALPYILSLFS
ncbi:MAG: TraB/GumN family protein [Euryarchaeota archaeon]|nr:TraB/GumN family protein [Euryarchaeota archaeon]